MDVPPADPSSERDALWIGVLSALALFLRAAPDLGYGDAGELGTAAVVLGVAHPTGFALDLLWLKAASLVPLGSLAFRLNVATALTGALALGLCASVIGAVAERAGVGDVRDRRLGVLVGVTGLFGFAAFASATHAVEVYALALCAVLLALRLVLAGGRASSALAVLVGLAAGLHVTAGLYVAPLFLAAGLIAQGRPWRFALTRLPAALAGALVLAYLPLASRRDPAIDWGDPETLSGVLAHLTAQRIRNAFHGEMFGGNQGAPALLVEQLSAFGVLGCFALVAAGAVLIRAGLRVERAPRSPALPIVIGIAIIACLDLAYALFVNPMGVRDLQCGHVAGACFAILGGVSAAWLLSLKTGRFLFLTPEALVVVVALAQLTPLIEEQEDGYALGELFGSGGPISALPPRAVFLCGGDNACAASLFALAVERVRPDVDTAPAQHLWDATVLRKIEGWPARPAATVDERAGRALENTRALMRSTARPLALETRAIATAADRDVLLAPLGASPFLAPAQEVTADAFTPSLAALQRTLAARFGAQRAEEPAALDERASFAWSRVYGELGSAALDSPAFAVGLRALQHAAQIAPARPTAWINLGVAFEKTGQLEAAIHMTQRGIELDPSRPTGWVNLARVEHMRGNAPGARRVLELAAQAGVRDPRLEAIAVQLSGSAPGP
jgi:tetratricopeptide (TPR) repeat protein